MTLYRRLIWKAILLIGLILAWMFAVDGAQAFASDQTNATNVFSWGGVVPILVGTVLPRLVKLVSSENWPSWLKFTFLGFLSALTGFLGQWVDAMNTAQPFAWQSVALTALLTFLTAEFTYLRGWKKAEPAPEGNGGDVPPLA